MIPTIPMIPQRWPAETGRLFILRRLLRGHTLFRNERQSEAGIVVTWHTAHVGDQVRSYADWSAAEAEELVARELVEECPDGSGAVTRYRLSAAGRDFLREA